MAQADSPVTIPGPLEPFAEGLWFHLLGLGYAPTSAAQLFRLAGNLSRWLGRRSLPASALTAPVAERFIRGRRRSGRTQFISTRSLRPILAFLSSEGAIPAADEGGLIPHDPSAALIDRYLEYLRRERGLAAPTILSREHFAECLLRCHPHVESLTAADVTGFFLRESKRYAVGSAKVLSTALRSFLRYLYVSGQVAVNLSGAMPGVAGWRLTGLPKALAPEDVDSLLRSCDRRTALGKRDFAVLSILAWLGLRAGEVRGLSLDDIRWNEGVMVVHGKGSVVSELPLPADIGRALVAYLHVRGRSPTRCLFLRARAPFRELGASGITQIVLRASRRAGLDPVCAHHLRHTVATEMLRRGGSLTEIAQALRHRDVDSTAIYAKVDTTRLQTLARRWPGQLP